MSNTTLLQENQGGAPPVARRMAVRSMALMAGAVVLALSLAAALATTMLVAQQQRRATEADLQGLATSLARSVDLKLRTYKAALQAVAQSHALRVDFDLDQVAADARRIGDQFGGWFVVATGGDTLEILMSTATEDGRLPPPEPRSNFPELMRAEAESLRSGRGVVSDAFVGRIVGELVVSVASAIDRPDSPVPFVYFSVSLRDITSWLEAAELFGNDFAAIADGSRRVIARSRDNEDFLLAGLPEWYVAFTEGRESGVAVGPPGGGGTPRLFAMQRLETAPGWTLAVSRPVPSMLSAAYASAWPALSALLMLLVGGGIAGLLLDRVRTRAQAARAERAAAERERLLAEIRAADARKSRLMAVLAHDLRTPLVAVLGSLDLLRGASPNAEAPEHVLERIERDGHGMLQLIDDVLELARLGTGEARLRPEPFAPAALLDEVADLVRQQAAQNGTEIVADADRTPPLSGDVTALRRVLMNFATNAVKATRGGRIRLSATAGVPGPQGRTVTFAVTDTGRGIAPEDIPRLFRDFGTLDREDVAAGGTGLGLGLAICRRLATAMGGEVGVESAPGAGSRFWLRLTLPEARELSDALPEAEDPVCALIGLRVLVAEDHETIRRVICAQLTRYGARPVEAVDGLDAVERAAAEPFDLILMDLRMPRLDGATAAARIRQGDGPSAAARIIAVTGDPQPAIAAMLGDLALDGCLSKPLDFTRLGALLRGEAIGPSRPVAGVLFDPDKLTDLRTLDGGVLLARSLGGLAREIAEAETALPALMANDDATAAGRLAHKLAGICDLLGARALSEALRAFEMRTETGSRAALMRSFDEIIPILRATRAAADNEARPGSGNLAGVEETGATTLQARDRH